VGEDATGRPSGRRLTVDEAARHLGLTVDAVRKRIQRGQIAHEKDAAGRVRIILDDSETLQDESQDITGPAAQLVEELRVRITYLERQVEEEREARRRADTILAQLSRANEEQARTIRAIEAPQEPSESPESPGPSDAPTGAGGVAQEAAERQEERKGFFRRFFGL
jgi:excisionase family DNA binding protein